MLYVKKIVSIIYLIAHVFIGIGLFVYTLLFAGSTIFLGLILSFPLMWAFMADGGNGEQILLVSFSILALLIIFSVFGLYLLYKSYLHLKALWHTCPQLLDIFIIIGGFSVVVVVGQLVSGFLAEEYTQISASVISELLETGIFFFIFLFVLMIPQMIVAHYTPNSIHNNDQLKK